MVGENGTVFWRTDGESRRTICRVGPLRGGGLYQTPQIAATRLFTIVTRSNFWGATVLTAAVQKNFVSTTGYCGDAGFATKSRICSTRNMTSGASQASRRTRINVSQPELLAGANSVRWSAAMIP